MWNDRTSLSLEPWRAQKPPGITVQNFLLHRLVQFESLDHIKPLADGPERAVRREDRVVRAEEREAAARSVHRAVHGGIGVEHPHHFHRRATHVGTARSLFFPGSLQAQAV